MALLNISRAGFRNRLRNEWLLLKYASKSMLGVNLIAVGIVLLIVLVDVFFREVDSRQTRFDVAMFVFEMYTPAIGILLLTNLLASESERGHDDLLRSSTMGLVTIAIRKIVYGVLWVTLAILATLFVWHLAYTHIDFSKALTVTWPGAIYFGMIGLLAATVSGRSLVGYTVAFGFMAVSAVASAIEPLGFNTYSLRSGAQEHVYRFFEESNWLIAKCFFLAMASLLAVCVVWLARHGTRPWRVTALAIGMVTAGYVGIHTLWTAPETKRPIYPVAAIVLEARQEDDQLLVWKAQNTNEWKGSRKQQVTKVQQIEYERHEGPHGQLWVRTADSIALPCHMLVPEAMDVDARITTGPLAIRATAHINARWDGRASTQLYFQIPWNFQVRSVALHGETVEFSKYGDLVTVVSPSLVSDGEPIELAVEYEGTFRPYKWAKEFDDNFICTRKWAPTFGNARLFRATATVTVPSSHIVASAERIRHTHDEAVYRVDVGEVKYFGLCVGRFKELERMHGTIPISLLSLSVDSDRAEAMLDRCEESLRTFESLFGPFPHKRLSIVENPFLRGSGVAENAFVAVNPDRLKSEHGDAPLNVLIPHEISHQWWGLDYPSWIAEGLAVFSNVLFLERNGQDDAVAELMAGLNDMFKDNRRYMQPMKGEANVVFIYPRAAYLWLMLREHLGEDRTLQLVDECARCVHSIRHENWFARQDALVELLAKETQDELGDFVNDWVSTTEQNDPALGRLHQQQDALSYRVTATVQQHGKTRFPVRIRFIMQDGTRREEACEALDDKQTLSWTFDQPVVSAKLNPGLYYLDWNRQNNDALPTAPASPLAGSAREMEKTEVSHVAGWTTYTVYDGLVSGNARCFHIARDGRVYVGHQKRGNLLTHLSASRYQDEWSPLEKQTENLTEYLTTVSAIATASDGTLWVAGRRDRRRGNALVRLRDGDSRTMIPQEIRKTLGIGSPTFNPNADSNSEILGHVIYQLLVDADDRLWIGTDHGVGVLDTDDTYRHFGQEDGLPGDEVLAMTMDAAGTIWIGTDRGVASCTDFQWHVRPECGRDKIIALASDGQGRMWIGTYRSGLLVVDGQHVRSFTPWNSAMRHRMVTALTVDRRDRVWAGTTEGLVCFANGQSYLLTTDNSALPSNTIDGLAADRQGRLWIGTDKGVTTYVAPKTLAETEI